MEQLIAEYTANNKWYYKITVELSTGKIEHMSEIDISKYTGDLQCGKDTCKGQAHLSVGQQTMDKLKPFKPFQKTDTFGHREQQHGEHEK